MRNQSTAFLFTALSFACEDGGEATERAGELECPGTNCPFDYATFDGASPEVSLKRDLLADKPPKGGTPPLGIFRRSCNFVSDCHGDPRKRGDAGLYLGLPSVNSRNEILSMTAEDITEVLEGGQPLALPDGGLSEPIPRGIVDVASKTNPTMMLVKPFEPENSFLMHKIDGCFEGMEAVCEHQTVEANVGPCGERMPASLPPLCESDRDTIRRWIALGARNN